MLYPLTTTAWVAARFGMASTTLPPMKHLCTWVWIHAFITFRSSFRWRQLKRRLRFSFQKLLLITLFQYDPFNIPQEDLLASADAEEPLGCENRTRIRANISFISTRFITLFTHKTAKLQRQDTRTCEVIGPTFEWIQELEVCTYLPILEEKTKWNLGKWYPCKDFCFCW